ncbi:MAG: hypothetical protein M0R33_13565 [Methylomonas sp.]|jgi:restriction system protein|uniref:hypothetical protein n=1 Tax=Methylomonas sp. TaxID=418 RepID=UPI0025FEC7D0|nr:hypothetical protein [Methylomonas sp.]MCK9607463.1 hypothetical protein [Methylomonas sp.]
MTRRRKNDGMFSALVDLASILPWWVNLILALVSYIILHNIAAAPQINPGSMPPGQIGAAAAGEFKRAIALAAQYIIPFGFLLGTFISFLRKDKK